MIDKTIKWAWPMHWTIKHMKPTSHRHIGVQMEKNTLRYRRAQLYDPQAGSRPLNACIKQVMPQVVMPELKKTFMIKRLLNKGDTQMPV